MPQITHCTFQLRPKMFLKLFTEHSSEGERDDSENRNFSDSESDEDIAPRLPGVVDVNDLHFLENALMSSEEPRSMPVVGALGSTNFGRGG